MAASPILEQRSFQRLPAWMSVHPSGCLGCRVRRVSSESEEAHVLARLGCERSNQAFSFFPDVVRDAIDELAELSMPSGSLPSLIRGSVGLSADLAVLLLHAAEGAGVGHGLKKDHTASVRQGTVSLKHRELLIARQAPRAPPKGNAEVLLGAQSVVSPPHSPEAGVPKSRISRPPPKCRGSGTLAPVFFSSLFWQSSVFGMQHGNHSRLLHVKLPGPKLSREEGSARPSTAPSLPLRKLRLGAAFCLAARSNAPRRRCARDSRPLAHRLAG
jgi:hypothetical protein